VVHTLPVSGHSPDPVGRKSSVPWLSFPSPSDQVNNKRGESARGSGDLLCAHKVGSSAKLSSLTRSDNPQSHPPAQITIANANVEVSSATHRRQTGSAKASMMNEGTCAVFGGTGSQLRTHGCTHLPTAVD
jgi:hypothetical protein